MVNQGAWSPPLGSLRELVAGQDVAGRKGRTMRRRSVAVVAVDLLPAGPAVEGAQPARVILDAALQKAATVVPVRQTKAARQFGTRSAAARRNDNGISWWKVAVGAAMMYGGNWMIRHEEDVDRLHTDGCFERGGDSNACIGAYRANESWSQGADALLYAGSACSAGASWTRSGRRRSGGRPARAAIHPSAGNAPGSTR